jgi:hypothetical protein
VTGNPEWAAEAEKAASTLLRLHQAIGAQHLPDELEKPAGPAEVIGFGQ